MRGKGHFFPYDVHREDLDAIDGINFTPRELDVISCIINLRGTRKISALLSISPNTVLAHTRNIMLKLGCNSREAIIDFIEYSQKLVRIKQHYAHLVIHAAFEKGLREVAKEKKQMKHTHLICYGGKQVDQETLCIYLRNHLKQAGLNVKGKGGIESKPLLILLEETAKEKIPKNFIPLSLSTFLSIKTIIYLFLPSFKIFFLY